MKVLNGYPEFVKTIEDGEEIENFSEESDEEVEVCSSSTKLVYFLNL